MQSRLESGTLQRRSRFWHRRAQLLIIYGCIALGCATLAISAGYVGMGVLAHFAVQHR